MKRVEHYLDLCGNVLPLAALDPDERRLVACFCRRADRDPPAERFVRWGFRALARSVFARRIPVAEILYSPAFYVLEDLFARLRLAKGKTPDVGFRESLRLALRSPQSVFSESLDMPEAVLDEIVAGGANTSLEDLTRFLLRVESETFMLHQVFGWPRRQRRRAGAVPLTVPDDFVDLEGRPLSLAGLSANQRRLIGHLRRRARRNPDWFDFQLYAYEVLGQFLARVGRIAGDITQSTVFRVIDDLTLRLRLAQGESPAADFRTELADNGAFDDAFGAFSDMKNVARCVLAPLLADGRPLSADILVQLFRRATAINLEYDYINDCRRRRRIHPPFSTLAERPPRPESAPTVWLYELHFSGGPHDSHMTYSFRPYSRLILADDAVYQAKMEGDGPVMECVDEETRGIRMEFAGYWPEVPVT